MLGLPRFWWANLRCAAIGHRYRCVSYDEYLKHFHIFRCSRCYGLWLRSSEDAGQLISAPQPWRWIRPVAQMNPENLEAFP